MIPLPVALPPPVAGPPSPQGPEEGPALQQLVESQVEALVAAAPGTAQHLPELSKGAAT